MSSPPVIEIISATRLSEAEFPASPLGLSLARMARDPRLLPRIAYENTRGLPEVYNERIAASHPADFLVFVHDDVWIEDYFFVDRLLEGFKIFDVIGMAGNSRRQPGQFMWATSPLTGKPDFPHLRGAIGHGDAPLGPINFYGPNPADCELLDGVFIAARKSDLLERSVVFDPQFDFHFYDLDFCRSARRANLRLGVWPIAMTHRSIGAFQRAAFGTNRKKYLAKWPD
jgi:Glycosyltransferase like family